uniref:DUF169 domain-containing protein n=1 Tax=candidate division WOR-3 bacterium TaxID=2052148 RepID=A0A7C2K1J0_UNCW3
MERANLDLSLLQKLGLEDPPVGVKFLYRKPQGVEQLEKKLPICEMIGEAQRRNAPFYITKENEDCFGAVALGMTETPPFAEAGQIGYELKIFREPRANSRIYYYLPKLHKGTVNYVVFARLDEINFDPDLLIILANVSQAEIIFRALDHLSGGPRESKTTGVFGCAWIFAYPYISGKVNFTVTGLHFGSKVKKAFKKEGMILMSIPFDSIPILIKGLKEIVWELPSYKQSPEKFKEWEKEMLQRLMEISKNP